MGGHHNYIMKVVNKSFKTIGNEAMWNSLFCLRQVLLHVFQNIIAHDHF